MSYAPRIVMVGSSNIDLIAYAPHLPMPGETLHGSRFEMGFGGKGANQAVMAAKLGASVTVITRLGRDVYGEMTLKNYRELGIDTATVLLDDERASGVALIAVDEATGQNHIVIVGGANDSLSPDDVQRFSEPIRTADALMCQLETPIPATQAAFAIAREAGVMTILNPAPAAPLPADLVALTDWLIPNEVEAAMLTGRTIVEDDAAVDAARALQAQGARGVIITLGARGALLLTPDGVVTSVPTPPVRAVDTTGAGDAFVGAFTTLLASGFSPVESVRRACGIAALSVQKPGTQKSFPTRAEAITLLT
jgi:ribokinase